ncbi:hypothetical protein CKO25_14715 [Thiocapsa imhoffii]|uniref:Uncharacterized protein n=1 Tax=Thiocapsa imhoffii TaxID=382777 RepID=A0A9X1BAA1_9GAMM|nr:hypothetical protein [Thiocapsa imhoffii]
MTRLLSAVLEIDVLALHSLDRRSPPPLSGISADAVRDLDTADAAETMIKAHSIIGGASSGMVARHVR